MIGHSATAQGRDMPFIPVSPLSVLESTVYLHGPLLVAVAEIRRGGLVAVGRYIELPLSFST
jgi:hypothetical protein